MTAWLMVLNLTVTVILGLLFGMMSMRIIHKIINKRFGKATGVAFVQLRFYSVRLQFISVDMQE